LGGGQWDDEAEQRPVTPETLFEPGSISKTLNAVGILKLAQEKKLDLYTDINIYLNSWTFPYDSLSRGKKITLANLLSHTGGLSVHGFPGHDINGPIPTLLQVLDGQKPSFTPAVPSLFEPGLKYQYSGGGTSISEIILEDLVQQPYETWMYAHVLKPIGMTNSTYAQPLSPELRYKAATAYNSGTGLPLAGKFHVYPEQAAAGLWMTPSDLCNYIIDMKLALRGQSSKVLNPEMVKLHTSPYLNPNAAMGTFIVDMQGAK
jgi:CubicO group peptidase (beta-lactamase class C family)